MNEEITQDLVKLSSGDAQSAENILPAIYEELKALAENYLRQERINHTLQATALVNEAWLRLVDQSQVNWQGRAHFFAIAAKMMRRVLIDHARKHSAAKRAGDRQKLSLDTAQLNLRTSSDLDLVDLDDALNRLGELNERHARVVELRFFAGLTVEETATILGVCEKTVKNDWQAARAWLLCELSDA